MFVGLIPAHAGKTLAGRRSHDRGPAHPRSRGENPTIVACRFPAAGSSPLTRGKRKPDGVRSHCRGLIPAHAGKTPSVEALVSFSGAHPRSRGENPGQLGAGIVGAGSSPLTRGKHWCVPPARYSCWLIPAHAGKTRPADPCAPRSRAHPRSRGENDETGSDDTPDSGSSPLTRGKLATCEAARLGYGLIPAHAGKTLNSRRTTGNRSAHPRSRGENAGV